MAEWTITDPETNESLTVSGDVPPDQNDAEELFTQYRASQAPKSTGPSPEVAAFMGLNAPQEEPSIQAPQKPNAMQAIGTLAGKAGEFLFPGTAGVIKNLPQDIQQPQTPQEVGATLGGPITEFAFGSPRQRQVLSSAAEWAPAFMGGITPAGFEQISKAIGPKAAQVLFRGAGSIAPRTLGAVSSGLRSAFDPKQQSLVERAGKTALSTGLGFGTGAVMEGAQKLLEYPMKQGGKIMQRLFRPKATETLIFERNTGMNFGDEIAKRDGKAIAGKDWEGLVGYFEDKKNFATQQADKVLASRPEKVNLQPVIEKIDTEIARLSSQGNAGPASVDAIDALNKAKEQIFSNVESGRPIAPVFATNNMKRAMQDLGEAAYSLRGTNTPSSNMYAKVASWINKELKSVYPKIDDINKETQLYKLAYNSISRRAEVETNKIANDTIGKLLQAFPVLGGIIGSFAGPGGAMAGFGGAGAMNVLRNLYFSPQGQSAIAASLTQAGQNPLITGGINAVTQGATQLGSAINPKIAEALVNLLGQKQAGQIVPETVPYSE